VSRNRTPRNGELPPVRKSLGQHFLTDRRILARIADAVEATPRDLVVEIGPGRGSLTESLLERAGIVVAIEYDRALAAHLRTRFAGEPRLRIVEADVLSFPLHEAAGTDDFLLVGNVPYYITTPIIFHALVPPRPRRAVYLVQREVAERIVAAAGSKVYGALSANVQALARARILFGVAAGAFAPPPRVESAVISIEPRTDPVVAPTEEAAFRSFVIAAFGMRRKQMRRVLRAIRGLDADEAEEVLEAAGVDPQARVETLEPGAIAALVRRLQSLKGSDELDRWGT
jgi:16S rRNA (adenine1518-N6/adenine1519-N6)-dimethyltransferase